MSDQVRRGDRGRAQGADRAQARKALKSRIRRLTARNWGISTDRRIAVLNRFIRGWCA